MLNLHDQEREGEEAGEATSLILTEGSMVVGALVGEAIKTAATTTDIEETVSVDENEKTSEIRPPKRAGLKDQCSPIRSMLVVLAFRRM